MTNIQELYDICSRENITIDFIDCPKCGAISLFGAGGCAIGIDSQTPARLLKERTAHEIGHCVKGAFYNRYATADNISQHEYRADKWAIENLIPKSELIKAIKKNLDSIYLLAQHFDVSVDFSIKAYWDIVVCWVLENVYTRPQKRGGTDLRGLYNGYITALLPLLNRTIYPRTCR